MSNASAPGKIILFGEHAVVYGYPALAVPVLGVYANVKITESSRAGIWVLAPNIDLHCELTQLPPTDALRTVIESVFQLLNVSAPPAIEIHIESSIPVASGLGSGAAVSVALIRALADTLNQPLADDQVNALAYKIEALHHGTPSGIDNTVITYAKPVYFVRWKSIKTFNVGKPFTLVIGYTGVNAPTKESVGDVRKHWRADKTHHNDIFKQIGKISRLARSAIEAGDVASLGPLMDANHDLLRELTVSSPALDTLVAAAKSAGAIGAKLSGGGRGGNMIALVEDYSQAEPLAQALIAAGAKSAICSIVQNNTEFIHHRTYFSTQKTGTNDQG